jgi:predicted Zn finger-like uncharacterized protein
MILARCPACSTTFRVRPEQLNARQGRVRCGQCQHAFNAQENQVEEEALADDLPSATPAATALVAASDMPLFVLQEKPLEAPASADDDAPAEAPGRENSAALTEQPDDEAGPNDIAVDATPEPPAAAPAATPEASADDLAFIALDEADEQHAPALPPALPDIADERIEPSGKIDFDAFDTWPGTAKAPAVAAPSEDAPGEDVLDEDPLDDDLPTPDHAEDHASASAPPFSFKPDWPDASELDLTRPPDPALIEDGPLDFDSLLHKKVVDDTPGTPLQALDRDIPSAPAAEPGPVLGLPIETAAEPVIGIGPADEPDEQDDLLEETAEPAGPTALQQAAWAAGATLLLLALLAQGVLVFRSDIAQSSPQMRLFMESVCSGMGCELPLPRESASITIESSDIQPDANREASFTLHATLRNRAEFAQAWPHLEITLTDARDKALVRRVLEPKQWLPADMPQDAFPARKEVPARVRFDAPGVAAAGYRVYAFYP